jgi:membrane protease subunit (stomatin/prohibitin family)
MAILDIIEFLDPTGEIIVARIPQETSGEFRLGSQLVVQEGQTAIFHKDGKILDLFGPGRHTLSTSNLPLLWGFIGLPFGGRSPFKCYVYFVANKTFINQGWGTPTPVLFRDTEFRMVNLRAHGNYSIRVTNPQLFCQTLVGTKGMETTYAIQEFFRSIIVSRLNEVLCQCMRSILDLTALYGTISLNIKEAVRADFAQYGIALVDLIVEAITVPPEVQAMLNRATSVAAQDAGKYHQIAVSDALVGAAKNPGAAGEGVGLGLGLGLAKQMVESVAPQAPPPPPAPVKPSLEEIREKLKFINGLKEDGLITEADFEAQKKTLLGQI